MAKLKPAERELLLEVTWRRQPALLRLVQDLGRSKLSEAQREEIRALLASELTEHELDHDEEPTERGQRLDDLIWRLAEF
jgi:hypothetical protein